MFGERRQVFVGGKLIYKQCGFYDTLFIENSDGRRKTPWQWDLHWRSSKGMPFLHRFALVLAEETGFPLMEETA